MRWYVAFRAPSPGIFAGRVYGTPQTARLQHRCHFPKSSAQNVHSRLHSRPRGREGDPSPNSGRRSSILIRAEAFGHVFI